MKNFVALALLSSACSFLQASDATQLKKNQPPPYADTDGYGVLSSVIDVRTEESKAGSVPIFHQTVSGDGVEKIRAECSSRFPEEFQSALQDFDKKAKNKFSLQRQLSIHKEYRFVDTSIPGNQQHLAPLRELLTAKGAGSNCWVMSENSEIDGREMDLETALKETIGCRMGTFLSCVPGRLVYFEDEDGRCILQR